MAKQKQVANSKLRTMLLAKVVGVDVDAGSARAARTDLIMQAHGGAGACHRLPSPFLLFGWLDGWAMRLLRAGLQGLCGPLRGLRGAWASMSLASVPRVGPDLGDVDGTFRG